MILVSKIYHFLIISYDYSMAVLYPKIVNALHAKNARHPYFLGVAKLVWQCFAIRVKLLNLMHCNTLLNQLDHTERVRVPCVFRKQSGVLSSYDSGTNWVYRLCYFGILMSLPNSLKGHSRVSMLKVPPNQMKLCINHIKILDKKWVFRNLQVRSRYI